MLMITVEQKMSTTAVDDLNNKTVESPGLQLSILRQQKGYTTEYVASKLHLRVRIIELIETGDFHLLPEPVFIKGYLRAYSKLLGISPDPLIALFTEQFVCEKKTERALWQSKKESHKAEYYIRLVTILFAIGVLAAVGIWWEKNREGEVAEYSNKQMSTDMTLNNEAPSEFKLTDLSKMQALLQPHSQMSPMEKEGG